MCIAGHSRNGKQSLVAAAFDDRIAAVVGSSPGSPIASPFRFSSDQYYGQDAITSGAKAEWFSWWAAKSREYVGAEDTMPTDGHGLLAMIAPRAAAIATASMDREGDGVYANEMSIREAATVYELLGAPANLTLLHRPGDHHGYNSITNYFDWLDERLARPHVDPDAPPVAPMVYLTPAGFDWARWQRRANASTADAPPAAAPLATRVAWLLDTTAPQLPAAAGIPDSYNEEAAPGTFARVLLSHEGAPINGSKAHANISSVPFSFGAYVSADAL